MKARTLGFASAAGVTAAALVGWVTLGVPALVRLPDDLDVRTEYEGTFKVFVAPGSGDELASPVELPLDISRHVYAVPGQVRSDTATVRDDTTLSFAGRTDEKSATYVLDRGSLENVPTAGTAVTDVEGTYSVTLPFGASSSETYSMWKAEAATSYRLRHDGGPKTASQGGVDALRLHASLPASPMTEAATARLVAQGIPQRLTPAQLRDRLRDAGIDDGVLAGVRARLDDAGRAVFDQAVGSDVPLTFTIATEADAFVQPDTGMVVAVQDAVERISSTIDTSALASLRELLGARAGDADAGRVLDALESIETPVYELQYSQTPASIAARGVAAADALESVRLAKRWVPLGLAVTFAALVLLALMSYRRDRKHARLAEATAPTVRPMARAA